MKKARFLFFFVSFIATRECGGLTSLPTSVSAAVDWRAAALKKLDLVEKELDANEKECLELKKTADAIRTAELRGARAIVRRAAFDIGSGATKVEVADVDFHVSIHPRAQDAIYSEKANILLTEDLESNTDGSFSPRILSELEQALKLFKAKAEEVGAEQFAGVATAAFRKAANGPEFLRRMETELGIRLRIVTQANLTHLCYQQHCSLAVCGELLRVPPCPCYPNHAAPRVATRLENGAVGCS
jgi:hypothetical protein